MLARAAAPTRTGERLPSGYRALEHRRVIRSRQDGGVTTDGRVFERFERTDPAPAAHSESSARFLDRVAGAYWDQVRDLVESWAARLPHNARRDLVARLRSPHDRQSAAAFWELYLHETFLRAGFDVEIHPEVEGPRPPDFRVTRGDERYYVEATCIFGSDADTGATARRQTLYDIVESIHSPNFFLSIDVEEIGPTAPATQRLRRDLEAWLAGLDPDNTEMRLGRELDGDHLLWQSHGWRVWFRPLPVRAEARGAPDHRVLGVFGSGEAQWLDDASELRRTIRAKGNAYGALDAPLAVAVMIGTPFHDDQDTISALFGTWKIQYTIGEPDSARSIRERDGYWGSPGDWKHTHVSGVLIAHNVAPWRVAAEVPAMWLHPHATAAIDPLHVWRRASLGDGTITHDEPSISVSEFYGVGATWPSGEAFPRRTS